MKWTISNQSVVQKRRFISYNNGRYLTNATGQRVYLYTVSKYGICIRTQD